MEFYHFVPLSFLCFYEYLKTFSYKIKNFQTEGCICQTLLVFNFCSGRQMFIIFQNISLNRCLFKPFHLLLTNTKIIDQYHITYTLCSGLNHVNYLNIIKRDHVSATVRTRLHLASGWSLDHSGAQYSYVGVRTRVGCRHMISFYNIPPIISVFKLQIKILHRFNTTMIENKLK